MEFVKPQADLNAISRYYLEHNASEIKEELLTARQYQPVEKDIVIVVHDQLDCIADCIASIRRNTKNYRLYIWDNASREDTASYLRSITEATLERSEENLGFIVPNNRLAAMGKSPYVILLNSDTIVRSGWDETMIAWLQTHPKVAAVGCQGGLLDANMIGTGISAGFNVDYLCGWCVCFPRTIYNEFGLFDEVNLEFAYGEDSDFSLRLKEGGYQIYAMFSDLVLHLQARTSLAVQHERDMGVTFAKNHRYLAEKWKHYVRLTPQ